MDANQNGELVLSYIKRSNLNFNIMESPFSLTITIKKSFIENKEGTLRRSGLQTTSIDNLFSISSSAELRQHPAGLCHPQAQPSGQHPQCSAAPSHPQEHQAGIAPN